MMKTNITFLKRRMKQTTLLFSFFLTMLCSANVLNAQCSLACNGTTQVSLDVACTATITPAMILNDNATSCPGGAFVVTVMDQFGTPISATPNIVGSAQIGQLLTVKVEDTVTGNSCWGSLVVEDKIVPTIDCLAAQAAIDAAPFFCYDLFDFDIMPYVTENCGIDTIILASELVTANQCDGTYADDILKVIEREYFVIDNAGNQSLTCALTFIVNRIPGPPFTNLVYPASFLESTSTSLSCDGTYARDENGHPAPSMTGVPNLDTDGNLATTVDQIALYPAPDIYCNLLAGYTDLELPAIGCVTKIIRTWSLIEWNCASRAIPDVVQMIEIVDNAAPVFTAPVDFTVTTNSTGNYTSAVHGAVTCGAFVSLPPVAAVDNCDTASPIISVTYPGGFLNNQNGGSVELPLGVNEITYTVYDACYNSSSQTFNVTVEDRTAPVAICIQNTVVGLTSDGEAEIFAASFDSGSYDDCKLDKVLVRRMDNLTECGVTATTESAFAPYVRFCCDDIASGNVVVIFRAYDVNGNFNDCMVSVEVQDKLAPSITCPANETVDCTSFYDVNNLAATFGDATAYDNCNVAMVETSVVDIDQCNVGTITRTFTATDDGGRTASCTQVITFQNPTPFGCAPTDITWPVDPPTMNGCFDPTSSAFHPDNTGYPTYSDNQCDLVGANYVDQVFPFNNVNGDACFKIIRDWTVIDWCQFGTQCGSPIGNQYATWTWTQVIKVSNAIAPTITSSCAPKSTCTFDALCVEGYIELTAAATDDCTEELSYTYRIDANNDGTFDGLPVSGVGNSIDASGDYPIGTHSIRYTFFDKCGNVTSCDQEFTIVNCKAPTPYCLNGLSTDLMPIDTDNDGTPDWGMVEIWASDFDNGSSHPCGYRVVASFSQDTLNSNIVFDCDTQGQQVVDVYFTAVDENDNIISFAYCTTFISIQDNMSACPSTTQNARIAGTVATENDETLENVELQLNGSALQNANTNANGEYAFPEMLVGGNYVLDPSKNVDPMNGVSTLDLVIIQRHILGIDNLDSPYKHMAADINNDADISAIDLVELRKLILGVNMEFSSNESWRFVDAAYEFINANDPLAETLPEAYTIDALNGNMDIDFTAVKVGDVNNTVVTDLVGQSVDNRFAQTLYFNVMNTSFRAGDLVEVPFTTTENVDILGYQFTLDFDANVLEFVNSKSGEILTNSYNYGTQNADQGMVTASWNTVTPELISADEIAFTIVFRAKADGTLANNVEINSQLTAAEAYDANQELMNIEVRFDNEGADKGLGYVLYQNTPNPFDNATEISFHLPESMKAQLRIYDVSGKTIKVYSDVYAAGMNMIVVDKSALASAGILYYTLETDNFTATKRMVVIK